MIRGASAIRCAVGQGRHWHSVGYPDDLGRNCRARIDMEEVGGSRVIDHCGLGHGTVTAATMEVVAAGRCRVFNGSSAVISLGSGAHLGLTVAGTLEAWVKIDREFPSDTVSTRWHGIISRDSGAADATRSYELQWEGTNATRLIRGFLSTGVNTRSITVSYDMRGGWKHVVFTWDPSYMRLYVNGVPATAAIANTLGACQVLTTPTLIGKTMDLASGYLEGRISDVGIYACALAAGEVLARFRRYAPEYGLRA
ncbi:MAG: hypothetical protein B7Z62_00310 [Deltaproteobacteria bacterium 37-65-8]|nr:MAG: hypothetical protein B7Z62_00310 [Deltaproteobacteria bacterium 37-65-8]